MINEFQLGVGACKGNLELLAEERLVQHVLHAQTNARHLVLIAGTNAALGGADVVLAQTLLKCTVEVHVIRHDYMGIARDAQVLGGNAIRLKHVNLFEHDLGVHHAAVANHRDAIRIHDAGGNQVQAVLLVAHDNGVPGVVTARIAHNAIELPGNQVDDFAFTLVAPLTSDQHC